MKKFAIWFLILALVLGFGVAAFCANVTFFSYDSYGNQVQTNSVTLTQIAQPLLYGGGTAYSTPKTYTYTNGAITVSNLVGGTWVAALGGLNKLIPMVVPPNDSGTYNYTTLTTSNLAYYAKLLNIFAYWPTNLDAWAQLSPSVLSGMGIATNINNATGTNVNLSGNFSGQLSGATNLNLGNSYGLPSNDQTIQLYSHDGLQHAYIQSGDAGTLDAEGSIQFASGPDPTVRILGGDNNDMDIDSGDGFLYLHSHGNLHLDPEANSIVIDSGNFIFRTNQIVFGGTNTPPVSTNLVRWISVQISGDTNVWKLGLAK
jgi:hypothetical protein